MAEVQRGLLGEAAEVACHVPGVPAEVHIDVAVLLPGGQEVADVGRAIAVPQVQAGLRVQLKQILAQVVEVVARPDNVRQRRLGNALHLLVGDGLSKARLLQADWENLSCDVLKVGSEGGADGRQVGADVPCRQGDG